MRFVLVALIVSLAVPALAAFDGPPAPGPARCPEVLITDHVYRWNGDDLWMPATMLPRLTVKLLHRGWRGWNRRPDHVEVAFDGKVVATFGYGDRAALSAHPALEARHGEHDRWQSRIDDVLRDTTLAWQLEIARARLAKVPLKLRFKSGRRERPEELFDSTVSDHITVAAHEVGKLSVTWISEPDRNSGPTILLRHGRTPIAALRVQSRWQVQEPLKQLRADIAYALAKNLPLTVRVTQTFPLTFQVDKPN